MTRVSRLARGARAGRVAKGSEHGHAMAGCANTFRRGRAMTTARSWRGQGSLFFECLVPDPRLGLLHPPSTRVRTTGPRVGPAGSEGVDIPITPERVTALPSIRDERTVPRRHGVDATNATRAVRSEHDACTCPRESFFQVPDLRSTTGPRPWVCREPAPHGDQAVSDFSYLFTASPVRRS